MFYFLECSKYTPAGEVIVYIWTRVIDILRSCCCLAVESCTGSDGGEGKQLSKLCAESRLSSTRLCSYHTKTTQDGGFLCN